MKKKTDGMTTDERIGLIEKNQKFQAKTEYVKWIVSILFFVGLVWLVDNNKKELKNTVYYNKAIGLKNTKRVDSLVKVVDKNGKKIKFNTARIDTLKKVIKPNN